MKGSNCKAEFRNLTVSIVRSREYLEATLITTKGLVERAKKRLDKLCTLKYLLPNFFEDPDVRKLLVINNFIDQAVLPKLTTDHYRVYVTKTNSHEFESSDVFKYYKYMFITGEYLRKNEYCNGFVLIFDYRDVNVMKLAPKLNPVDMRQAFTVLMEGYGMRVKGIHLITHSKTIEVIVSLLKQILSPKICDRIHVHKDINELYDSVPKEILPIDLGGDEKSLKTINEGWVEELSSNETIAYLIEMSKATTNESYRQTDKFNESYLGIPGSFRNFNVD